MVVRICLHSRNTIHAMIVWSIVAANSRTGCSHGVECMPYEASMNIGMNHGGSQILTDVHDSKSLVKMQIAKLREHRQGRHEEDET